MIQSIVDVQLILNGLLIAWKRETKDVAAEHESQMRERRVGLHCPAVNRNAAISIEGVNPT
ncbi:MAG: hypothetical protein AAFN77_08880 [Planctomycetota bacterium]